MMTEPFPIRRAVPADRDAILMLYREVAAVEGGIAREPEEITPEYVDAFLKKSLDRGLVLVAESHPNTVAAEIHAYPSGLRVFHHVLSDLTIVVHPNTQGRGLGKKIFSAFLEEVKTHRRDIKRVELIARESNARGIRLYESLEFAVEGRLEGRIRDRNGRFEADIPMAWTNPNFLP